MAELLGESFIECHMVTPENFVEIYQQLPLPQKNAIIYIGVKSDNGIGKYIPYKVIMEGIRLHPEKIHELLQNGCMT